MIVLRIPILYDRSGQPYVMAEIRWGTSRVSASIRLVVDTGASDLTLSMRDVRGLDASRDLLEMSDAPISGIGGQVDTFIMNDVSVVLIGSDICETSFPVDRVSVFDQPDPTPRSGARLRVPSLLGRRFMEEHGFTLHWDFARRIAYIDIAEPGQRQDWRSPQSTS